MPKAQEFYELRCGHPIVEHVVSGECGFVERDYDKETEQAKLALAQNKREVYISKVRITLGESMLRWGKERAIVCVQ